MKSPDNVLLGIAIFMITVLLLGGCSLFDKQQETVPTNAPEAEKAKATIQNTKGEVIGEIKKGNYLNQSDFYREAIRDKIRSIKKE